MDTKLTDDLIFAVGQMVNSRFKEKNTVIIFKTIDDVTYTTSKIESVSFDVMSDKWVIKLLE